MDAELTPDQREQMEAWLRANCGPGNYGEQDENGVDLSLIRSNLNCSPLERLRRGDRATTYVLWLRENVRTSR